VGIIIIKLTQSHIMNIKKIFKITASGFTAEVKPDLANICVRNNHIYATDSFRSITMRAPEHLCEKRGYIKKGTEELIEDSTASFPPIDMIIDDLDRRKDVYSVKVNRKYLIEILEAMEKEDSLDQVIINLPRQGYNDPFVFKNKNATALLMPIRQ
jgi:hypothetical protein